MIKIKSCEKTYPMFWECVAEDGKRVYIRYRWGWLKVVLSPCHDKWETLIDKTIGDGDIINTSQMMEFTKDILDFEEND